MIERVWRFFTAKRDVPRESTTAVTPAPILCAKCGSAADTIVCRSCRQPFELTLTDRAWYAAREMSPPKRCVGCRRKRREGHRRASTARVRFLDELRFAEREVSRDGVSCRVRTLASQLNATPGLRRARERHRHS